MGSAGPGSICGGLFFRLGVWIAIAYFAVVRFLSYIDRRIRLEGWEIELQAQERRPAPSRRDRSELLVVIADGICGASQAAGARTGYRITGTSPRSIPSPSTRAFQLGRETALRRGKVSLVRREADRVRAGLAAQMSWLQAGLASASKRSWSRSRRFFDRFKWHRRAGAVSISGSMDRARSLLLAALARVFFGCLLMLWMRRDRRHVRTRKLRHASWEPPPGWAIFRRDCGRETAIPGPRRSADARRETCRGAIVCLFAHQLLTLDQLGLIRLAPGKTGRHYVQGLRDRELADRTGRDAPPVRGCLLRTAVAHARGVRVGLEAAPGCSRSGGGCPVRERRHERRSSDDWLGSSARRDAASPSGACRVRLRARTRRTAPAAATSLNGTSVLAEMLEDRGHEVRAAIRLNEELADWAGGIVRFAPYPGPPDVGRGRLVPGLARRLRPIAG